MKDCNLNLHHLTHCRVIGPVGVNKQEGASLDGIDDGLRQFPGERGAAVASSQPSGGADDLLAAVVGTVNHDGARSGLVVNALFQPVEQQRITVPSLIGATCAVKTQRALV